MDKALEKEIIQKAKKDLEEFTPIYEEYSKDVYRYVLSLVKDDKKAEEITQETFVRGLEKLDQFEWKGISIKNWFLAIARNQVYAQGRKKVEILNETEGFEEVEGIEMVEEEVNYVVQKDLNEALYKLPVTTREIIILKIWEEYKFVEIADLLEININTVKTQFYRGITKLRKMLERKGHKKDTIILPVIFRGIMDLKTTEIFMPSSGFSQKLVHTLEETLRRQENKFKFSNKNIMRNLFKGVSKQTLMLIGAAVTVVVVGGLGAVLVLSTTSDDRNDQGQEQQEDQNDADSSNKDSDDDGDEESAETGTDQGDTDGEDGSQPGTESEAENGGNSTTPERPNTGPAYVVTTHNMVDVSTGEETDKVINVVHPSDLNARSDVEYTPPNSGPGSDTWHGYIEIDIKGATLTISYYYNALACDDRYVDAGDEVIGTIGGDSIARFYHGMYSYYYYLADGTGCEGGYMTFANQNLWVQLEDVPEANKQEVLDIADEIVLSIEVE
jgi:RNA polymerase sigma-70 factor (ECF subfamily)